MKKIKPLVFGLLLLFTVQNGFGQTPNSGQRTTKTPEAEIQELRNRQQKADMISGKKDASGMISRSDSTTSPIPRVLPRPEIIEQQIERRREFQNIKVRLLAPAEYYKKYETFLRDEDAGLARLFVYKNCDQGKIISVQELERCDDVIPVKGEGAYYTFRSRRNYFFTPEDWDISYMNDKFIVGNEVVQGIIAEIGDVALEDVNLGSAALAYLKKYNPKTTKTEIKEQNELLKKGIKFNNFTYSNSVAVRPESTYVLRSTAYLLEGEKPFGTGLLKYRRLSSVSGRGLEVMMAFKVVGREDDGSLILLWKELQLNLPRRQLK